MRNEKLMNYLPLIGQMLMMVVAVVAGGGVGLAAAADGGVQVTSTPEAQVVNPTNQSETEGGNPAVFPEQSVTTAQQAAPEVYEDQYDTLLTKIRPVRTPIDQISRRAARSKNVKAMEFKYGTIDYMPIKTTLKTQIAASSSPAADFEPFDVVPANVGAFNRRDIIIVKGVKGYAEDGVTQTDEDLKLWVLDRDKNTKLSCIAINGKTVGGKKGGIGAAIPTGTVLVRIAKACAELDSQAPGYAIFPVTGDQYCQKFMAQVEQSTIDKLTAKRFDITLSDQEEATLADMRLGMEGAFIFGTKAKFLDPDTNRFVWTTQGIWNQVAAKQTYKAGSNFWTINQVIDMAKTVFTGSGAGKSDKRLVICGSDLLAELEKAFVGNYTFIHKVSKWDLTFTEVQTNFGSFMFILDEVFDLHGQAGDGLILDAEYLERFTFEPFHANTLDLDAQGTRDSKARVLREISAMVLKSPKNHMKIVATA